MGVIFEPGRFDLQILPFRRLNEKGYLLATLSNRPRSVEMTR
jgi:hypothetical protein